MTKVPDLPFEREKIFTVTSGEFEQMSLEIFHYQAKNNDIYKEYLRLLGVDHLAVHNLENIPFLPVGLFKERIIKTGNYRAETVFESSTTSGQSPSRHHIRSLEWYQKVFTKIFMTFYGNPANFVILALLPSYLERKNASLVFMAEELIKQSNRPESGFYLSNLENLSVQLKTLENKKQQTILLGVSFALLDFSNKYPMELKHTIVMETGGMKGRRQELWKSELHEILQTAFSCETIQSEYGMTEMHSQAYSSGNGVYHFPAWCKALIRDSYDPLQVSQNPGRGGLNIIDLANIDSCCFLATDDLADIRKDGSFSVLGRLQSSEIRGCNLMVM